MSIAIAQPLPTTHPVPGMAAAWMAAPSAAMAEDPGATLFSSLFTALAEAGGAQLPRSFPSDEGELHNDAHGPGKDKSERVAPKALPHTPPASTGTPAAPQILPVFVVPLPQAQFPAGESMGDAGLEPAAPVPLRADVPAPGHPTEVTPGPAGYDVQTGSGGSQNKTEIAAGAMPGNTELLRSLPLLPAQPDYDLPPAQWGTDGGTKTDAADAESAAGAPETPKRERRIDVPDGGDVPAPAIAPGLRPEVPAQAPASPETSPVTPQAGAALPQPFVAKTADFPVSPKVHVQAARSSSRAPLAFAVRMDASEADAQPTAVPRAAVPQDSAVQPLKEPSRMAAPPQEGIAVQNPEPDGDPAPQHAQERAHTQARPIKAATPVPQPLAPARALEDRDAAIPERTPSGEQRKSAVMAMDDSAAPRPKQAAQGEPVFKDGQPAAAVHPPVRGPDGGAADKAVREPEPEMPVRTGPARPPATREISMRVTAPEAPDVQVDVKLVDRAGSVRVAVRTADAGMAQDLRSGLTDLVHRLEHKGFEAETWSPASNPGRAYSNAAQQERDATQDNPGGARHGSPQHDNGQQPGGRNRPRWVAELEQRLEGERE